MGGTALSGSTVLVTGGGSGIGRLMALGAAGAARASFSGTWMRRQEPASAIASARSAAPRTPSG
ncbi:hypothetical protein [Naasia aerilata]|uniref:hypothetical protein n=1 Tax=Naasia aerilata TaxID=1162966 RepID=UPI003305E5A0